MDKTNAIETDVVVVGAGLAGLAAAWRLTQAGARVLVLEARDRVGGRTWTEHGPGGIFIDQGGQFVRHSEKRILALADEMGVGTFKAFRGEGDRYVSVQGRHDLEGFDIGPAVHQLESMAKELPLELPWTHERAMEWDAQTVQSWMLENVPDSQQRSLLRLIISAVFTAEPDELSLLHLLVHVRGTGWLTLLTQTEENADQESRFDGGAQTVSKRVAAQLGEQVVKLSTPVRRIEHNASGVIVEAELLTARCREVIVAVPIPLMDRIIYSPALPGQRVQLHQRLSPGATTKVQCVYDQPFWRADGHSGYGLADDGYIAVTFDNSCPENDHGIAAGFMVGDRARAFARLPAVERRRAALEDFGRVFGQPAASPIAYYEQTWLNEEWTRGCYGSNFGPAGWTRFGTVLHEPIGRIHWAGTETAPLVVDSSVNSMDSAVRSGERAAADVLAALG